MQGTYKRSLTCHLYATNYTLFIYKGVRLKEKFQIQTISEFRFKFRCSYIYNKEVNLHHRFLSLKSMSLEQHVYIHGLT